MPKLSSRPTTTTTTDGWVHIILPDGGGGFNTWQISYADFIQFIQDQIDVINSVIPSKRTDLSQNATYQFELAAGTKLISMDIQQVSGTVDIKIGTTLGGDEIMPSLSFATGIEPLEINIPYADATTIYITRTSGTFNLITSYITDWL